MKWLEVGFLLLCLTLPCTFFAQGNCPQPQGAADYVYPGNPPGNMMEPNSLFIIESGTYSGSPDIEPQATVWIKSGANWDVPGSLNQMKGTIIVDGSMEVSEFNVTNTHSELFVCNGGNLTFTGSFTPKFPFYLNSGSQLTVNGSMDLWSDEGSIENDGTLTADGNMAFNAEISIINKQNGVLDINGELSINNDDAVLENFGSLEVQTKLDVNGGSFINKDEASLTANIINLNQGASLVNDGLIEALQDMNINQTLDEFENSCSIIARNEMNIYGDITNDGTLYVRNNNQTATLTITSTVIQDNIIVADNFTLHNSLSGTDSQIYIYEESKQTSGTLSGTINFYDKTDDDPDDNEYFDIQYGSIGPDVTNVPMVAPTESEMENCPEASNMRALPVTWLSTEATQEGETIVVSWSTANEIDNTQFQVERFDQTSEQWEMIDSVSPAGAQNRHNSYSYTDRNPQFGTNIYRIKQVDIDGRFSYSEAAMAQFKSSQNTGISESRIFPNPVRNQMTLSVRSTSEQSIEILILNQYGIQQHRRSAELNAGRNNIAFDPLSHLPPGHYNLYLITRTGDNKHLPFIKISE